MDSDKELENKGRISLIWIWGIIFGIVAPCLFFAPYLFPNDEYALSRALVLRVPVDLINAGVLLTALILLDVITPGNSLQIATSEPMSASVLLGTFMVALAIIIMAT